MKRNLIVFLLFALTALALYFPTAGAGFVTDHIGWLESYKTFGWQGLFNAFGDRSAHFVYHLFGFTMWSLFGMNGYAWMAVFVLLHALTATLAFHLFSSVFKTIMPERAAVAAFIGSLLFLVNPYQTETLVWYACIHYLVCAALCLGALIFLVRYLQAGGNKNVAGFYACFVPAVFALEISFSLPLIAAAFILLLPFKGNKAKRFGLFVLPAIATVGFYFLLNKLLRGNFAGHYGAAAHFNFDVFLLAVNFSKYCSKIFLLSQFWPYAKREWLYQMFVNKALLLVFVGSLAVVASAVVLYMRKAGNAFKTGGVLFIAFGLALAPIINLFFYYIDNVEGDRFTYFASVFAMQLVAFVCVKYMRVFGWALVIMLAFMLVYFLRVNTVSWEENNMIRQSLLSTFKYANAPHVYMLNLPDNYRGTYMFRTALPDNSLAATHKLMYGTDFENRATQVLSYNMNSLNDSVTVEKISDTELKVTFAQWGNWWWQGGVGANSYSTDKYDVVIDEWNHAYNISFKEKVPGAVYLYQCGKEWRKVQGF